MKKVIKSALIIFTLALFIGFVALYGLMTGDIRSPSDLTRSAQSAETLYAKVTADIEAVNFELTKMSLEQASTLIPTPLVTSQNWLDHFLHSPTCQIPCWENITPNSTEIETAKKIVAGISGVQVIYLEPKEITWYFDDDSSKSARIIANHEGIVLQIDLKLGYDQTLLLSDVVESFGEPNALIKGMDCNHILSYRHHGMLLSAFTSCSYNPRVDMMPTTQINRIILFSPDNQEYTLSVFRFNMDEIIWDGYKSYDFTNEQ